MSGDSERYPHNGTEETDWTRTCWHMRFAPRVTPCMKPATWKGPENYNGFDGQWRACDEHRQKSDVPLAAECQKGSGNG